MANMWEGILATVGPATGNTTVTIGHTTFTNISNRNMWDKGWFGVSFIQSPGTNVSVFVTGFLGNGAVVIPVAGITALATTVSRVLPILTGQGAINGSLTQGLSETTTIGIPTPRQVVCGNSGIVGRTYQVVVYGTLYGGK